MTTDSRDDLHKLIDDLSEDDLGAFRRLIEEFCYADDEVSPDDEAAIREGREAYRAGKTIPWSEVRRELVGDA